MITQEKKQSVKEAIIRAVPSVMDLKFGCRFFFKGNNNGVIALTDKRWKRFQFFYQLRELEPIHDSLRYDDIVKDIEIIGRPITIADVLIAIEKSDNEIFLNYANGGIAIRYNDYRTKNGINKSAVWDLSQDFDHQSEETYDFLWSLLCE